MMQNQGSRIPVLPKTILNLGKLEELRRITRTERYIEIGAMVHLNEIIFLGKVVPEALTRCLEGIADPQIRNLATIGGNLCCRKQRLDASAPMIALDATYELRSASSVRRISASRFSSIEGDLALNNNEILTRIRLPLEQWDYSVYKKFSHQETDGMNGAIVCIFRNQKNILADLRVVFSGGVIIRDKNSESLLIGKSLPLSKKDAVNFLNCWETYLQGLVNISPLLRFGLTRFIESGLSALMD
jgi:CO/xanthine dehydrogenase FAD-binding subunit